MCSPARCPQCGKTTYRGCGQHVDQVKATVPADQWCGHEPTTNSASTTAR